MDVYPDKAIIAGGMRGLVKRHFEKAGRSYILCSQGSRRGSSAVRNGRKGRSRVLPPIPARRSVRRRTIPGRGWPRTPGATSPVSAARPTGQAAAELSQRLFLCIRIQKRFKGGSHAGLPFFYFVHCIFFFSIVNVVYWGITVYDINIE